MKAAVVRSVSGPFVIEELQDPRPKADEVLVKVAACGVCHTDLHVHDGSVPFPMPCVLGHEINNSLTPIKSIAGTLRSRLPELTDSSGEKPASDLHRGLVVIEERAASLNRFLQAYQQLTHLPTPQLQRFPLRDLLEQLVSLETRLPVTVSAGPFLEIQADRDQLEQLLINVIRNAVDAATYPESSADHTPEVILRSFSTTEEIIVQILDNGPGLINPANLFVPFYTTKPNGSGIGLVLARQIAVAHRGSLTLVNRSDTQGCTAELRLPMATSAS